MRSFWFLELRMEIEKISISEITEYENNAKLHPREQIEQIKKSIQEFGNNDPIAVDENNVIIEGHGRYKALKELGFDEVEVIRLSHMDDEQKRAYILAHNKLTMNSGFDIELLNSELESIVNIDMEDFGFDYYEPESEVEEDDFEVEETKEPIAKLGDIYRLGRHRLMCGDSTDPDQLAKLVDGQQIDLIVTDPPYNVAYEGGTEEALTIMNDSMDNEQFRKFLRDAFFAADTVLREGGAFYIWHADSEGYNFRGACSDIGWTVRQCLIWNKNTLVLGRQDYQWKHEPCLYGWKEGAAHYFVNDRSLTTIIEDVEDLNKMTKAELVEYIERMQANSPTTIIDENKPTRNGLHPTMKPLRLIERLVRNSSKKGWNVLDSFNGSGSTMIVCEDLGRNYFGMELDPRYVDATIQRWEEHTGQTAVKLN